MRSAHGFAIPLIRIRFILDLPSNSAPHDGEAMRNEGRCSGPARERGPCDALAFPLSNGCRLRRGCGDDLAITTPEDPVA